MEKLPISLIVVAHNDGKRLSEMIQKHKAVVSEVIIVDQGSTDTSVEACAELADLFLRRKRKGVANPDLLWAHSLGKCEYILYLDTDEYLSAQALEDLPKLVAANFDCVWFNRRNFVDGVDVEPILKNDQQLRLFKRGAVRYHNTGHSYPEVAHNATVLHSPLEIVHERTLKGLVKANKARETTLPPNQIVQQNKFIEIVTKFVKENEGFTEDWYSSQQLESLKEACAKALNLSGAVVEIGSWEGKSTCAIANTLSKDTVIAVDSWQGNTGEGDGHPSVVAAKQRDVLSKFKENVKRFTTGNVEVVVSDCFDFLSTNKARIKFCHIDASHDYASVKKAIGMVQPFLVKGAVLCGDDFMSANAKREDLGGGVERAVVEMCPGFVSQENFWYWINK